jgi:hypothetical protein
MVSPASSAPAAALSRAPEVIVYHRRSPRGTSVGKCPSPYWMDRVRASALLPRRQRRRVFPPPADTTPMIECGSGDRRCSGRFHPGYYNQRGNWADVRTLKMMLRELPGVTRVRVEAKFLAARDHLAIVRVIVLVRRTGDAEERVRQYSTLLRRSLTVQQLQLEATRRILGRVWERFASQLLHRCEDCRQAALRAEWEELRRQHLLPGQPADDEPEESSREREEHPFTEALDALQCASIARGRQVTIQEHKLAADDDESVLRQIKQYEATGQIQIDFTDGSTSKVTTGPSGWVDERDQ